MMTKPFENLLKKMSPESLDKVEERTEQMLLDIKLKEIRNQRQITQIALADKLSVNQSAISKMENQADMLVSTLKKIVRAMGGKLWLVAEFPDEKIILNPPRIGGIDNSYQVKESLFAFSECEDSDDISLYGYARLGRPQDGSSQNSHDRLDSEMINTIVGISTPASFEISVDGQILQGG